MPREPLNWTALEAMTKEERFAYMVTWAAKPAVHIAFGPDAPRPTFNEAAVHPDDPCQSKGWL